MKTFDEAIQSAQRSTSDRARDAFLRMPPSHQAFARACRDAFGKPSAVRLELDGETILEMGWQP